jgi:hypothetical protein
MFGKVLKKNRLAKEKAFVYFSILLSKAYVQLKITPDSGTLIFFKVCGVNILSEALLDNNEKPH